MRIVLNVRHYTTTALRLWEKGEGDEKELKQISFFANPYLVMYIFLSLEVLIWPFAPRLGGVWGGTDNVCGCMRRG
jgi:hypothetical protein